MLTFDQIPEPVWRRVQQLTGRTDEHFCKCVAAEVVGAWPWAKTEAADEITRLRAALIVWRNAYKTGRNEPLVQAYEHSEALAAPPAPGKEEV